jgi:hypothetical protein
MQLTKTAIRFHPLGVRTLAFLMAHFAPVGDFLVVTGLYNIGDVALRVHLEYKSYIHTHTYRIDRHLHMITFIKLCSLLLYTGLSPWKAAHSSLCLCPSATLLIYNTYLRKYLPITFFPHTSTYSYILPILFSHLHLISYRYFPILLSQLH